MLKRFRWRWALVLALMISGCAVKQDKDVRIYRDVLDSGKSGPAVSFHPEDPLTLKAALGLANAQNEQLSMSGENYLQALIDKDRALAAFLPAIHFDAIFMHQKKTALAADNPLIAALAPETTADMPLAGDMDLHPFRDIPALQSAGSSAKIQQAKLLDHQAILLLDVAGLYFQVMRSEKQVQVLRHSLEVDRRRLGDIRMKEASGVARPVDVALCEAQLAKTRNMLIAAQDDVKNSRAMLAFLIGVPELSGPLVNGLTVPSTDWRTDALLEMADKNRQDLIVEQERVKAAANALEAAWGEYFPSVSLNLTRYLSRDTAPSDVDWTSLIQVHVPIFSAGLIHADVRTAYSRLRQARLAESYARRQVLKDLRLAVENIQGDDQQMNQLRVQVAAAREGARQAEAAFNAGLGTHLEKLTAQDALLSAELDLSTARFNRNIDYVRLLRVTGVLNPELSVTLSSDENNLHEARK